jgi:hypothetical protein
VLLAADRACYVAKRQGRDRVATAAQGLALAAEFLPVGPTPVDEPTAMEDRSASIELAALEAQGLLPKPTAIEGAGAAD